MRKAVAATNYILVLLLMLGVVLTSPAFARPGEMYEINKKYVLDLDGSGAMHGFTVHADRAKVELEINNQRYPLDLDSELLYYRYKLVPIEQEKSYAFALFSSSPPFNEEISFYEYHTIWGLAWLGRVTTSDFMFNEEIGPVQARQVQIGNHTCGLELTEVSYWGDSYSDWNSVNDEEAFWIDETRLLSFLDERINNNPVYFNDYIAVIAPSYDGINQDRLKTQRVSLGNRTPDIRRIAIFGRVEDATIISRQSSSTDQVERRLGVLENTLLSVETHQPDQFSYVELKGVVRHPDGGETEVHVIVSNLNARSELDPQLIGKTDRERRLSSWPPLPQDFHTEVINGFPVAYREYTGIIVPFYNGINRHNLSQIQEQIGPGSRHTRTFAVFGQLQDATLYYKRDQLTQEIAKEIGTIENALLTIHTDFVDDFTGVRVRGIMIDHNGREVGVTIPFETHRRADFEHQIVFVGHVSGTGSILTPTLQGFINEQFRNVQLNYNENVGVVIPYYNGVNLSRLKSEQIQIGPGSIQALNFAVFGKLNNIRITYQEYMDAPIQARNIETFENTLVTIHTWLPWDMSYVMVEGTMLSVTGEPVPVRFSLDDMRDLSEFPPIIVRATTIPPAQPIPLRRYMANREYELDLNGDGKVDRFELKHTTAGTKLDFVVNGVTYPLSHLVPDSVNRIYKLTRIEGTNRYALTLFTSLDGRDYIQFYEYSQHEGLLELGIISSPGVRITWFTQVIESLTYDQAVIGGTNYPFVKYLAELLIVNSARTFIDYNEHAAVIMPMYDGINKPRLTPYRVTVGNNPNTQLSVGIFGELMDVRITHYRGGRIIQGPDSLGSLKGTELIIHGALHSDSEIYVSGRTRDRQLLEYRFRRNSTFMNSIPQIPRP